jgi:hypothetical protein
MLEEQEYRSECEAVGAGDGGGGSEDVEDRSMEV